MCTKIDTVSKNYQFQLDIPLVDCYNIKVRKRRSWNAPVMVWVTKFCQKYYNKGDKEV